MPTHFEHNWVAATLRRSAQPGLTWLAADQQVQDGSSAQRQTDSSASMRCSPALLAWAADAEMEGAGGKVAAGLVAALGAAGLGVDAGAEEKAALAWAVALAGAGKAALALAAALACDQEPSHKHENKQDHLFVPMFGKQECCLPCRQSQVSCSSAKLEQEHAQQQADNSGNMVLLHSLPGQRFWAWRRPRRRRPRPWRRFGTRRSWSWWPACHPTRMHDFFADALPTSRATQQYAPAASRWCGIHNRRHACGKCAGTQGSASTCQPFSMRHCGAANCVVREDRQGIVAVAMPPL